MSKSELPTWRLVALHLRDYAAFARHKAASFEHPCDRECLGWLADVVDWLADRRDELIKDASE